MWITASPLLPLINVMCHFRAQQKRNVEDILPRLRLLRYCLRHTLPSWLGAIWPTSRATAALSPTTSMPMHTDCTFNTSTDTWRTGVPQKNRLKCCKFICICLLFLTYFKTNQGFGLTTSLVGSSAVLWEVALTVSGDTASSCSWTVIASAGLSVAICSLMVSLKPEIDMSSVFHT